MNSESDSGICSKMSSPVVEMEVIATPSVAMDNIMQADEEEVGLPKEIETPSAPMENNVELADEEEVGLVEDFVNVSVDSANDLNADNKRQHELNILSMNVEEELKSGEKDLVSGEDIAYTLTTPANNGNAHEKELGSAGDIAATSTIEENTLKADEKEVEIAEEIKNPLTNVESNDKTDDKEDDDNSLEKEEKSLVEETAAPPVTVEKDLNTVEKESSLKEEEIKCLEDDMKKKEKQELELVEEIVTPAVAAANDLREEEEEFIDETILERLQGLGEMFPEGLRDFSCNMASSTKTMVKGAYHYTRVVAFFAATTSLLLFAPAVFEMERVNMQEVMRQDRNRAVLGPGMAMAGGAPMPSR